MRLALVSCCFLPAPCAPAPRLHSLARRLALMGHEVTVVTGPGKTDEPRSWAREERLDGFRVLRSRLGPGLGRPAFVLGALAMAVSRLGRVDVVLASSPSLCSAMAGWLVSLLKRAPLVLETRGPAFEWSPVLGFEGVKERVERLLLGRAKAVVSTSETLKKVLLQRGIPEARLSVIPDCAEHEVFCPGEPDRGLIADLAIQGKLIVLYAGSMDPAHALDVVLDSAKALSTFEEIVFVLVGDGPSKPELMERARTMRLKNVRFLKGQDLARLPRFYRTADICLVPVKDAPASKLAVPSKLFEIMACEKPIAASVRGETAFLMARSGAGLVAEPGDAQALTNAILMLKADPERRAAMARSGREFVLREHDPKAMAERYLALLEKVRRA